MLIKFQNKIFYALIISAGLVGCGTLRNGGAPDPAFDLDADLASLSSQFESATKITNYYQTAASERKDARNRFISGRLVQIDLQYLKFIRGLTSDKQQMDAATEIANMSLNLAGTLVGGVRAKANLAAGAAGISGAKSTIDKDFYYEKSIQALVATMNAKRKEVLLNILAGLTSSIDQYPFERAVTDTYQYYLAGTLNGAIQFINVQAAQSETATDQKLNVLYQLVIPTDDQIKDIASLTDALASPAITLDSAIKVLKALGIPDAQLPSNLNDAGGKPGAKQMLKDQIRSAKNTSDETARSAAVAKLVNTFKAEGLLKQ